MRLCDFSAQHDSRVFFKTYMLFFVALLLKLIYCIYTPIPISFGLGLGHIIAILVTPILLTWMCIRPPRLPLIRVLNGVALLYIGALGTAFVTQATFFTGRHLVFVDDRLAVVDKAIGFDWLGYMRFIDSNAWLDPFLATAYASINIQPFILALLLACNREARAFCAFLSVMMLGPMVVAAICAVAPALGPFEHYALQSPAHPHITLDDMQQWLRPIMQLRAADVAQYTKPNVGLITFPSFHAMSAIFYIWYAWRIAVLRWILLGLNLMMLASTPLYGSHYIVDVIAGAALAVIVIAVVHQILADAPAKVTRTAFGNWEGAGARTVPDAISSLTVGT